MLSMSLVQAARVEVRLPMSYNKRMAIIAAGAAAGAVGLHCLPKVVGKLFPRSIVRGLPELAAASSGVAALGAAVNTPAGPAHASLVGVPPLVLPVSDPLNPMSSLPEANVEAGSVASAPAAPRQPLLRDRVAALETSMAAMQQADAQRTEAQKIAAEQPPHPAQAFGQLWLMQNLGSMGVLQQVVTMFSWPMLMSYGTSLSTADIENFFSHNVDVPWGTLRESIEHYKAIQREGQAQEDQKYCCR